MPQSDDNLQRAPDAATEANSSGRRKGGRLILNLSSLITWTGPPVGIIRVENVLATHALTRRPDIALAVFDRFRKVLRRLDPRWAPTVTGWSASIDLATPQFRRSLPLWRRLVSPRYPLLVHFESRRLTSPFPAERAVAAAIVRALLGARHHPLPLSAADGQLATVPAVVALPESLVPRQGDVLLCAGADWYHIDADTLRAMKQMSGLRIVLLCYDIIPLLFPQFFPSEDGALVHRYWRAMFPLVDRVIFTARQIETDARNWCARNGIAIKETRVVALGNLPAKGAEVVPSPLRAELAPGKFALFVSTIEPRKGHALLIDVWEELLARNLPQQTGFKLVFVGRAGWMVDEVLARLDEPGRFGGTLLHLSGVDDAELAGLYDAAAFCLYPSLYEGFGLPVTEAFSHGKPVIASTGGALPETVAGLSPCLDPEDRAAWRDAIARWITDPTARAPYEALIREQYRPRPPEIWASDLFDAAM